MLRYRQFLLSEMTADQETDIISTFISTAKNHNIPLENVLVWIEADLNPTTSVNISASNISFRKGKDRVKQMGTSGSSFNLLKLSSANDFWPNLLKKINDPDKELSQNDKALLSLLWLIQNKPDVPIVSYQASKSGAGGDKTKGKLANATPLFEQVAAAAFRLADNDVVSLPDDNTELINLIRGVMDAGYKNTDSGGTKFTDENWNYYTEQTGQVRKAAQGSFNFINQYGLKPGNMEIIWSDMKPYYYAKMRSYKKYAVPNKKENTADMAILFGGLDIGTLFGEDYHISNETEDGYLEVINVEDNSHAGWLLQVSLKIGKEEAQVGKSGKDYQPYSSIIDPKTKKKVSRKALTLQGLKKILNLHHDPIDEGFFGDLAKSAYGFVKHSLATLKRYLDWTISKLSNLHGKLIKKMSTRNVLKQSSSLLRTYARRLNLKEEFLVEKKMKDEDIVDAVMADFRGPEMVTAGANHALDQLRTTLNIIKRNDENNRFKINIINNLSDDSSIGLVAEDIRYLLCNTIAFETLNEFYRSVIRENVPDQDGNLKNILSAIADYTVDMGITTLMGESLLPVLKLYGDSTIGGSDWEVLQRSDVKYTDAKKEAEKGAIDIGGIDIGRSIQSKTKKEGMGYYTVQQITLAKYENGKPTYNKVQLRTGGKSGGFAFFIEANKQVNEVKFS